MATTYLTRTPASTTNQRTFTISFWLKRSKIDADMQVFGQQATSYFRILLKANGQVRCYSPTFDLTPTRLFRDTSGWYHICLEMDTTESVAADRANLYVNGVKETAFFTETYPGLNDDLPVNTNTLHKIGAGAATDYFDGLLSYFYFIDGTAYPASTFGSTDATTGEWTLNTSPTVTMGTNGFSVMQNGNTITDQSSNSNDLTLGAGTLTNTEDCPSDVFATGNSLPKSGVTFTNGNTTADNQTDDWTSAVATLGAFAGKYYAEYKIIDDAAGITRNSFGCCDVRDVQVTAEDEFGYATDRQGDSVGWGGAGLGVVLKNGVNQGSGFNTTYTIGDIISVALDCDNGAIYFRKNADAWLNSGDPTSGATRTGAVTLTTGAGYCLGGTVYSSTFSANYGNGYFGTTAISSAGTNASNIGIFEYDVPTGYTALSTKGLQE